MWWIFPECTSSGKPSDDGDERYSEEIKGKTSTSFIQKCDLSRVAIGLVAIISGKVPKLENVLCRGILANTATKPLKS